MHDVLDLNRFPLHLPGSPRWHALVDRCRADLADSGMFNLEALLRPDIAAAQASAMAPDFANHSFRHERSHNIYFLDNIKELSDDHPALQRFTTSNQTLCADQITDSVLTELYEWPPFAQFLAATMDQPALFLMDDPLARINVMSYRQGQALNWHFDRSEFTTTMLLQAPEQGGEFEYRTDLRSDDDPNYEGVAQLLQRGDSKVKTLRLSPGTLNVFKGKNCAHRVTPVSGPRDRVIAVFSFYDRPGVAFSDAERLGFYGRAS